MLKCEIKHLDVAPFMFPLSLSLELDLSITVQPAVNAVTFVAPPGSRWKHFDQRENGKLMITPKTLCHVTTERNWNGIHVGANIAPGNVSLWGTALQVFTTFIGLGKWEGKTVTFSSQYHQSSLTKYITQIEQSIITSLLCSHKVNE